MSFQTRGSDPTQSVPVYTVYSEGHQGNVNYGFHQSHPQAPPPKYEDVISGRSAEQRPPPELSGTYETPEQRRVIFVAPVYNYMRTQRTLGLIFAFLFVAFFVTAVIKVLGAQ